MKRLLFFCLALCVASCFSEEGIELGKPATFIKYYSDGYANQAVTFEETSDGGFIILMNSSIQNTDAETPRDRIVLIKTDPFGTEVRRTYYPVSAETNDPAERRRWRANSLTLLDDGGYLVIGESINDNTGLSSMLLMRTDANETLTGSVNIPSPNPVYSMVGRATTIRRTNSSSNGNILYLASSQDPSGRMVIGELRRTDLSTVWTLSRGTDVVTNLAAKLFYNITGSDSLMYWGGTVIKSTGERSDIRITKNPINTIPGADPNIGDPDFDEEANDVCLSGSILAFVGSIDETTASNNTDIYFYKGANDAVKYTDNFIPGNKTGFTNDKNEYANSIATTRDGGFIILATIDTYTGRIGRGNTDMLLMKIDGLGGYQWSISYGGINADQGKAARQTSDGGYAALGTSNLAGVNTIMLVKTDNKGGVD